MVAASKLPIDTVREGVDALDMAQTIFGSGTTVIAATYSGDEDSAGIYRDGDSTSPGAVPSDRGVILSTGNAERFTNTAGQANRLDNRSANTDGENNLTDFNAVAGASTFDAAYLDVDFRPTADVMTMQFVFASEEFPEFQNSIFQDFVAVWINGTEVPLAAGNGDVDPGSFNDTNNVNLYVDNTADEVNTEMDGLSITLSLTIPVNANVVNTIRIGIADVVDPTYDSNLLIAADSLQVDLVAVEDAAVLLAGETTNVDVFDNDINNTSGLMLITHVNDVPVSVGSTVTLKTGQTVTVNPGGNLTLVSDGTAEDFVFTYTASASGLTDVGIVNVSSVPCFVAGMQVETPGGPVAVETLGPGDLVLTRDAGPQPVRWVGQRTVRAEGVFAPIWIRENTFGRHGQVLVSPEHRVLIRDSLAELLFGEAEVLVAAKNLLSDHSVLRRTGGWVSYVHIMFDAHQVVWCEGLQTESFLPGPQTKSVFEADLVEEITRLFPEIDPETGAGYSPAARRTLRSYEAGLWLRSRAAA